MVAAARFPPGDDLPISVTAKSAEGVSVFLKGPQCALMSRQERYTMIW